MSVNKITAAPDAGGGARRGSGRGLADEVAEVCHSRPPLKIGIGVLPKLVPGIAAATALNEALAGTMVCSLLSSTSVGWCRCLQGTQPMSVVACCSLVVVEDRPPGSTHLAAAFA